MTKRSVQEQISKIPSYTDIPDGVFKDINHYKRVLANVTKALARGSNTRKTNGEGSYLFDGFEIEYTHNIKIEEIFLDHLRSKIVLRAPVIPKEPEESRRKRTMFYHGELLKSVEAMRVIGITTIYLVVSETGRKKLGKASK